MDSCQPLRAKSAASSSLRAFAFAREDQIGSHRLPALAAGYKVVIKRLVRISIAAGRCAC